MDRLLRLPEKGDEAMDESRNVVPPEIPRYLTDTAGTLNSSIEKAMLLAPRTMADETKPLSSGPSAPSPYFLRQTGDFPS